MEQTAVNKGFVMLPRFLLGMSLSDTTKLIYALLLDRSRLSLTHDEFKDEDGRAFVFYTADQIANDIGRTSRTVLKSLAALEREGLIERQRQGLGFASRIFVLTPHMDEDDAQLKDNEAQQDKELPEEGEFFSPDRGKNFTSDTKNDHLMNGNIFTSGHENNSPQDMKTFHTSNNKYNNTKNSYTERVRGRPRGRYKNVFLSDEEYASLNDSYNMADEYIEKLSRYISMHGKKYACHDAVLRSWLEEDGHKKYNPYDYDDPYDLFS